MNKSYRTLWNEALGAWVAISEIGKSCGKKARAGSVATALTGLTLAFGSGAGWAQAVGGGTSDGSGTAISPSAAECANFNSGTGQASAATATRGSIAIGCAKTTDATNIAIGAGAQAMTSVDSAGTSIAIGPNAIASAWSGDQLAIGKNSVATGVDSTAIGAQSQALARSSIALGGSSIGTTAEGGVAADSGGGIAIGFDTQVSTAPGGIASQLNQATQNSSSKWITANPLRYVAPSSVGSDSTAIGSGATSTGQGSVALGTGASDEGRANVVSIGSAGHERQLSNLAAGTEATDAVNLSQLRPVVDALGGGSTINTDGSVTGPSYHIKNVAADGSITANTYDNVGDALGGLSHSVVNLSHSFNAITEGGGIKYFRAHSTQADAVASGAESTALGPQAQATGDSAIAAGDRAVASGSGSVAMGQQSVASGISSIAVGTGAEASNTGSIAIGMGSRSSGLHTVAIGTGAVATNSVAVGAGAQAGGGGAAFGDNAIAIGTIRGTAVGNAAVVSVQDGVALGSGSVASRTGMNGQLEAISNTAITSSRGAVAVGSAGSERQITNVAGGTEATDAVNLRQLRAVQAASVQYASNADGSVNHGNVVLGEGNAPNGTTVSNVAPGVQGSDAVNLNQLNTGLANANQHAERLVAEVQSKVDQFAKDASAGTAGAMAMANLPQAFIPGKSMVSAGVAGYDGQAALAVGLSKLSDNGRWVIKLSGTANSRGKVGLAAGAGFHW